MVKRVESICTVLNCDRVKDVLHLKKAALFMLKLDTTIFSREFLCDTRIYMYIYEVQEEGSDKLIFWGSPVLSQAIFLYTI